jgi:rubrerythrin
MADSAIPEAAVGDFVEFWESGTSVTGEFHCSECGYVVAMRGPLPACPTCSGTSWEQSAWSPFSRSTT